MQGHRKHRARFLDELPLLLECMVRGDDDMRTVRRDIDVPGFARVAPGLGNLPLFMAADSDPKTES
jgi:hypothetical protein